MSRRANKAPSGVGVSGSIKMRGVYRKQLRYEMSPGDRKNNRPLIPLGPALPCWTNIFDEVHNKTSSGRSRGIQKVAAARRSAVIRGADQAQRIGVNLTEIRLKTTPRCDVATRGTRVGSAMNQPFRTCAQLDQWPLGDRPLPFA